jgi:hypothetical protein
MRIPFLTSTLIVVGNMAVPAWGADLARIDRAIAREPAYQTKAPRYCLVAWSFAAPRRRRACGWSSTARSCTWTATATAT